MPFSSRMHRRAAAEKVRPAAACAAARAAEGASWREAQLQRVASPGSSDRSAPARVCACCTPSIQQRSACADRYETTSAYPPPVPVRDTPGSDSRRPPSRPTPRSERRSKSSSRRVRWSDLGCRRAALSAPIAQLQLQAARAAPAVRTRRPGDDTSTCCSGATSSPNGVEFSRSWLACSTAKSGVPRARRCTVVLVVAQRRTSDQLGRLNSSLRPLSASLTCCSPAPPRTSPKLNAYSRSSLS